MLLRPSSLAKTVACAAFTSVATAALFFGLFVAMAIWAPQDHQTIRRHLVEAIQNGDMAAASNLGPVRTFTIYRAAFDCILFSMMLAPVQGNRWDAVGNRMVAPHPEGRDPRVAPYADCQALVRALPELGGIDPSFTQYDRYVLGTRVLGRILLSAVPLPIMRVVLLGTAYALLALIGFVALRRLATTSDPVTRERAAGHAAIAASLGLCFGAHFFDATLNFGPMDCVQYLFVLISLICPLAGMRRTGLALYGASYGSLIAIFEFLTGGIPLALALLPLLLALGYREDRMAYLGKLITLWGCFCVAVVATFVIKKLYAVAFLGDTENFIALLLHRTYGSVHESGSAAYSLPYFIAEYYRASALIGWGSSKFGALLVVTSLAVIAGATARRSRLPSCLLIGGWLSLAALASWIVVFLNHTILHAFFMGRFLVIPVIVAATLMATSLIYRPTQTASMPVGVS